MSRIRLAATTAALALMLLAAPQAAQAQDAPAAAPAQFSIGATFGPSVPIEPSGGSTLFWFGAEGRYKFLSLPVIINPQSGQFKLRFTPRYIHDIEVMPKLTIAPFGGLDAWFGFGDLSTIALGLTVGAKASYQVLPNLSVFAEPLTFDLPLWIRVSAGGQSKSDFDFRIGYRAMFGAAYHF